MSKVHRRSAPTYSGSPAAREPPIDNTQIDSLKKHLLDGEKQIRLSFASLTDLLSLLQLFDQSSIETD